MLNHLHHDVLLKQGKPLLRSGICKGCIDIFLYYLLVFFHSMLDLVLQPVSHYESVPKSLQKCADFTTKVCSFTLQLADSL